MSEQLPSAMRLDQAFDDPAAIRRLVEVNGPFASIASYLPPAATGVRSGGDGLDDVLPWFRSNWVVNGRSMVDGAEAILHNHRFIEAACAFLDVDAVEPSTVVVNVNAPMRAGAIHQDIPAFRGAGRDRYSLTLLQAMGTSGLFEPWRIVEVGAVSWFYAGAGGAYDYWPDGLDGPMAVSGPRSTTSRCSPTTTACSTASAGSATRRATLADQRRATIDMRAGRGRSATRAADVAGISRRGRAHLGPVEGPACDRATELPPLRANRSWRSSTPTCRPGRAPDHESRRHHRRGMAAPVHHTYYPDITGRS